ncbi:MAG: spore cortex biosynthesis protein YabQ [Syntrophothermus sp.]
MEPVKLQAASFFITVLAGLLLGLLFDTYRVMRRRTKPRGLATSLGDLLFWVVATSVTFTFLLLGNWGELRLYVFVGLFLGVGFYYWALSRLYIRFLAGILRTAGIASHRGADLVALMIRLPWYGAERLFYGLRIDRFGRWLGRSVARLARGMARKIFGPISGGARRASRKARGAADKTVRLLNPLPAARRAGKAARQAGKRAAAARRHAEGIWRRAAGEVKKPFGRKR